MCVFTWTMDIGHWLLDIPSSVIPLIDSGRDIPTPDLACKPLRTQGRIRGRASSWCVQLNTNQQASNSLYRLVSSCTCSKSGGCLPASSRLPKLFVTLLRVAPFAGAACCVHKRNGSYGSISCCQNSLLSENLF